ncbi:MAG: hypothetical protein ACLP9L_27620 [Thermoguttaceae bacterium]
MDKNLELTSRCLTLISRIAARGACCPYSDEVADTLMELASALLEPRRDTDELGSVLERRGRDLDQMHQRLDFIDSTSRDFTARDVLKYALQSTWN